MTCLRSHVKLSEPVWRGSSRRVEGRRPAVGSTQDRYSKLMVKFNLSHLAARGRERASSQTEERSASSHRNAGGGGRARWPDAQSSCCSRSDPARLPLPGTPGLQGGRDDFAGMCGLCFRSLLLQASSPKLPGKGRTGSRRLE